MVRRVENFSGTRESSRPSGVRRGFGAPDPVPRRRLCLTGFAFYFIVLPPNMCFFFLSFFSPDPFCSTDSRDW